MLHVFEIFSLINASASFMKMKENSQRRYLRSTMTRVVDCFNKWSVAKNFTENLKILAENVVSLLSSK